MSAPWLKPLGSGIYYYDSSFSCHGLIAINISRRVLILLKTYSQFPVPNDVMRQVNCRMRCLLPSVLITVRPHREKLAGSVSTLRGNVSLGTFMHFQRLLLTCTMKTQESSGTHRRLQGKCSPKTWSHPVIRGKMHWGLIPGKAEFLFHDQGHANRQMAEV